VIEAVLEELGVKQDVFAEIEKHISPDAILATNTSSLSVEQIGAKLAHPERLVGFHFFNPVAIMPLLEIVRAEQTDDATLATAFSIGKSLKKSCVLVKDAPRFLDHGGALVVEVGHNRAAVEAAFPRLPVVWLTTAATDEGVFLVKREDLVAGH